MGSPHLMESTGGGASKYYGMNSSPIPRIKLPMAKKIDFYMNDWHKVGNMKLYFQETFK